MNYIDCKATTGRNPTDNLIRSVSAEDVAKVTCRIQFGCANVSKGGSFQQAAMRETCT